MKKLIFYLVILIRLSGIYAQPVANCPDSAMLRIGLIADPQYCDCDPSGNRIYREVLKKLPAALDTLNRHQVDFVMNLGDMIDRYYESYDSVRRFYEALNMPFYNLFGNHEFEEIADSLMPGLLPRYGMPDYYYQFVFKNWRFLVLDGTELAAYSRSLHPEMAAEGDSLYQAVQDSLNNRPWNGGIGRLQRAWINDQLEEAFKQKQLVILFCHFPVYPDSIYLNLWNDDEIVRLIGQRPHVVAYINGHYHPGNYGFIHGIHYITQAAMLDTYEHNSFSILEIYSDRLAFKGFGLNPDRQLFYKNPYHSSFSFTLSDSILQSPHAAGSFIGRFIADSGLHIQYHLAGDSAGFYNQYFLISQDSLFLKEIPDTLPAGFAIRVLGVNCASDTISRVFFLSAGLVNTYPAEVKGQQDLLLYPNPVKDILYIGKSGSLNTPEYATFHDLSGRMIARFRPDVNPQTGIAEVKLGRALQPGFYIIRLQYDTYNTFPEKILFMQ